MNLKKIIKEEMDDLQWIKDINPEIERFNTGEIIRVHSVGDEEAFLDFIGMWKDEYLRGDFGPNITGRVSLENHLGTFGLMVKGRDGDMAEIYFPYPRLMKAYQNSGNYPGLGVEYEVLPKESITESEDVFKWMKDVQEVLPKNEDWILVNDVDIYDIEEGKKIQKYVFNHDIPWATGDKRVMSLPIHTIHHKNQQKAFRKGFTYRTTDSIERTKEIIEQWEKAGLLVLYWSQIKPKEITESDDLQWIKDVKVNPWDEKEFKLYTETDLYPSTTYKILDWGDPKGIRVVWRENDDYRNKWKHTHYTREEVEKYVNNGTWVIVNENITESEDDLEWIRNIEPENPYNPYIGMKWVVKDEKTLSLEPIAYEIIDMTQEGMTLKWVGNMGEVKSAPFSLENYFKLVKDGRVKIVNNIVKESDDLQWIKDIKPDRTTPQKGFIYRYYGYADGFLGEYDGIDTDDIIITAVVGDIVYFDTINRYWANHPHDPGSDSLHITSFNRSVGRGDIQYLGISGINESEDDNELQWIMDIKTNSDIAQEIYDGLEWYKEPNVSTDFVKNQWSDINFSVRPGFTEKPIISPSSFYRGFTKWVEEKWGIEKERTLDVYWKLIALIHNKIKNPITESDDPLQWMKDINPIPELKVGSCFIDSVTQREWTIVGLPKVGKSRTEMVRVLSNTIRKEDGAIIPSKYVNIRREYFEWDLLNGRYKPCQR